MVNDKNSNPTCNLEPDHFQIHVDITIFSFYTRWIVLLYCLWPHAARQSTHLLQSSGGRCLTIIHPYHRTLHPLIFVFSYTSRNSCPVSIFRMTEGRRWVSVVPILGGRLLRHRIQKLVQWYDICLNSGGEYRIYPNIRRPFFQNLK